MSPVPPEVAGVGVWRLPGAALLWRGGSWLLMQVSALWRTLGLNAPPVRPVWVDLESSGFDCSPPSCTATDPPSPSPTAGSSRPRLALLRGSYKDACSAAVSACRPLVMYIHSSSHQDSEYFCSETLRDSRVLDLLRNNYLVWAISVQDPEGNRVASTMMLAEGYPFLAVLLVKNLSSPAEQLLRVEGPLDASVLAHHLQQVADATAPLYARMKRQAEATQARARLRSEQQTAFEDAQALDALRQIQQEAAQLAAAAEQQRAEEERRQAEREEEEAALRKEAEAAAFAAAKKAKWDALPPQPAPGNGICTIRVNMPCGVAIERRFRNADTVQAVRDFVCAHELYSGAPFSLSRMFPQQSLPLGATLQQAGLCPRAVVVATDICDRVETPLRPEQPAPAAAAALQQ